jgi:hypothetical protein
MVIGIRMFCLSGPVSAGCVAMMHDHLSALAGGPSF